MYPRERFAGSTLDDVVAAVRAGVAGRTGTSGTANPWVAGSIFLLALIACWTPIALLAVVLL
jgi:hypothetical protein